MKASQAFTPPCQGVLKEVRMLQCASSAKRSGACNRASKTAWLAVLICLLTPAQLAIAQPAQSLSEGVQAYYRGDYPAAASLARQLAKAQPGKSGPNVLLARAEASQGNLRQAFEAVRQALRINPNDTEALYFLAHVCTGLSQAEHQRLFAMAPGSARVHQILAESFRVQENLPKAEEEYQAALRADPNLVEVLNVLGDMKRYQFKFEEAITYYSRAAKIRPRDYDSAYGLGASQLYLQKPDVAVEHFQNALSINPKSAAARLALGDALLRQKQFEAAAKELEAAIQIDAKMRQAYTLLGKAYQQIGQTAKAKQAFAVAQKLIQEEMQGRERRFGSPMIPNSATSTPPAEEKP
jgi:tetratricopeptide (TPR) repeat protein